MPNKEANKKVVCQRRSLLCTYRKRKEEGMVYTYKKVKNTYDGPQGQGVRARQKPTGTHLFTLLSP